MDASDYEQLNDTIELHQEINQARQGMEDVKGIEHEEVMSSLKERLGNS